MARRVRHHVNPLSAGYLARRESGLSLPATGEVEVEVGCAEAQFLFERARQDPTRTLVGLEIREELVAQVNRQAAREQLPVTAVHVNVNVNLDVLFAPGRVARFFVNFPDPCFKRKHRKRRVMDAKLVIDMARALVPGGEVLFQSDVWDVAMDAMAVLEGREGVVRNVRGPWTFLRGATGYGARSTRETWCEAQGIKVWRMLYRTPG